MQIETEKLSNCSQKILTIIIPTYNMEKYLRKCLDSLLISEEKMRKLDVLVINDGSKDSSLKIAQEYETKYSRTFRVIDKKNGNYGSCVNCGLKEAKGRYVKILDSDDTFNNQAFSSFISFLEKVSVDLVISDFNIVDENGSIIKSINYSLPQNDSFSLSQLSKKESIWLWHHAITYRRDIFNKFDYKQTEGISYSDEEWVLKPMAVVHKVAYYHNPLYLYLRGREGQTYDPIVLKRTRKHKDVMVNSLVVFYEKYREQISDSGAAAFMYNRVMMILSNMYRYYFLSQRTEDGLMFLSNYDKDLKFKCNFLYNEMGKYKFMNKIVFYYVQRWRMEDYNDHALKFFLYRLIYKIIKVLKNAK